MKLKYIEINIITVTDFSYIVWIRPFWSEEGKGENV